MNSPLRLLYQAPSVRHLDRLIRRWRGAGYEVQRGEDGDARHAIARRDGEEVHAWFTSDAHSARRVLAKRYVNALVLDARPIEGTTLEEAHRAARELLDVLDDTEDVEARYGFHRIVALTGGRPARVVDRFLAELGGLGVRHVLRERPRTGSVFELDALADVREIVAGRREGQCALCASGGGITGIYFELGALKALDDAIPGPLGRAFDMYFGISAGAVVTSLLAVGYSATEIMAGIARFEGGRLPNIDLSLVRLGHLNLPDAGRRLGAAGRAAFRQVRTALQFGVRRGLEDALLDYTALVGPPFRSDRFEELLRGLLSAPGATNDFRQLPRPLYVGATDQDARRHVLFGGEERRNIPISKAVQASLSINPAFSSVEIDGRWYEDGAVTRTSGFADAVERDADLVFVIDPFVPYVSRRPGSANRRGVLYNLDQEIRTISFTRYQRTRDQVLRRHPEVSAYTFLPSNRVRKLLSVNPMDHRPYLAIWRGAYLSTVQRLERLAHRLRGDLAAHGIGFDLDRAQSVADRLFETPEPTFEDFFVDRRVDIETPPLVLDD